ncbi:hypothetical protein L0U88_20535 [Flavihumibacter sp. RY-1]|uniref:Uncharacterized protein n=1 Tax=Flavihumibacter fluminis TaxID=2909236 RepID=A0ABS9BMU6_9BACT|nr:hypothetical protein [Flavihumibacter fluminis]MCF1717042.1 hypothetical protein [Flavihumibacter fluminis]
MTVTLLDIPVIFGLSIEVYFFLVIIAIPTFLFWRWLLKKYIKGDRTRKIATWSATLIGTPIIYVGLIILFMFGMTYTPSRNFDKSEWLTDRERRFQMAGDIITSKMLLNKDTNQVKQILGEPTWGSDSTWRQDTINIWTYEMGMGGGGLGFLFHNLIIKFDKEKVAAVEHTEIRD